MKVNLIFFFCYMYKKICICNGNYRILPKGKLNWKNRPIEKKVLYAFFCMYYPLMYYYYLLMHISK